MAVLSTVADYIETVRILLQDTVVPYRYTDASLTLTLNQGLLEMRRLRPDLFLENPDDVPSYSSTSETVDVEPMYRMSLVFYMVGTTQVRDTEDVTDARAASFLNRFTAQLTGLA